MGWVTAFNHPLSHSYNLFSGTSIIPQLHMTCKKSLKTLDKNNKTSSYTWQMSTKIKIMEMVVAWYKIVWSTKIIPRHQFILWLVFRKRLATRDRMKKFINIPDVSCPICKMQDESIDHLFGECSFVSKLWFNFAGNMNITNFPGTWNGIVDLVLRKAKGDSFYANVFKCFFGALVYNIWRERNLRIYSKDKRNEKKVWDDIVADGNALIHSWRGIPINESCWKLSQSWNIPYNIVTRRGLFK